MQPTPFYLIFLAATADSVHLGHFSGFWENKEPQSEIAGLQISTHGKQLTVHAWARCEPGTCEWGDADAVSTTPFDTVRTAPSVSATYKLPDRQVVLILQFEDADSKRIQLKVHTHFTDDSGRPDLLEYDSMQKGIRPKEFPGAYRPSGPVPPGVSPRLIPNPPRPPRPPAPSNPKTHEAIPEFPWPPPQASADGTIPRSFLAVTPHTTLSDVNQKLMAALDSSGYLQRSYYPVNGGFAVVTGLEQIEPNGAPKPGQTRWSAKVEPVRTFSLWEYLRALFTANPGHYRVIVFTVTAEKFTPYPATINEEQASRWISKGWNLLPEEVGSQAFTAEHSVRVFIYEFDERAAGEEATLMLPKPGSGSQSYQHHLASSNLWAALERGGKP
jgi:hypothetical protein